MDSVEGYEDRRRWYALCVSIFTGITADKALMFMTTGNTNIMNRLLELLKNQKKKLHNEKFIEEKLKFSLCIIDGCREKHFSKGMCTKHYQQKRKGTLGKARKICSVDGCSEKHQGKGMCKKHYQEKIYITICKNCGKQGRNAGCQMCITCYQKEWRKRR